ncbi:hypothetical protein L7F22_047064 [Adiantum nelumboides]|nr:hypothetical protein [Adiantum nelumboides]
MKPGDDTSSICMVFKNILEEAMQSMTTEVYHLLNTSMWRQWKGQERSKWDLFCTSLRNDYRRRLDDMINGVLKFDNVVSEFERKMKREIVELIELGKLQHEERDAVFEDIFDRILNEAKALHEPFAHTVPTSVKKAYGMFDLTQKFSKY